MNQADKLEHLLTAQQGMITRSDAVVKGINPRLLSEWVKEGKLERVQRGVYCSPDALHGTLDTWLEVSLRVPQGVVCLLSAALFHELVTFAPSEVFMALPNKAWRPKFNWPPVRYFYFSGSAYSYGLEEHPTSAGVVKIYSPEKTVADLLRYRNKLGENLFLEALKTYLGRGGFSVPKLLEAARACHVEGLMQDYAKNSANVKNLAASVKARLLNIARKEGRDFNRVLLLYMQERFLARLAVSDYQDRFILKGGVFLYLRYGSQARPTVDLDLLGRDVAPDLEHIAAIMREVTSVGLEDGVRFDSGSVNTTRIREAAVYEGVRVKLTAYLESARVSLQVDVGFGDVLTPRPRELSYPTLLELEGSQPPAVLAYAIETVVAEKFQAMVVLGILNSRFKDFYDLYVISQREQLEAARLRTALEETFARRGTPLEDAPYLFEPAFAATPALHQGWARLRTANPTLDAPEDFAAVVERIARFLNPFVKGVASGIWRPEQAAWSEASHYER